MDAGTGHIICFLLGMLVALVWQIAYSVKEIREKMRDG